MKIPLPVISLFIAGASLCLTACGSDDPDEPAPVTPSGPNAQPDPVTPVPDPAGTVEVNMPNNGTEISIPGMGGRICIDAGNNFVCTSGSSEQLQIISVDAVNSLGNITSVPSTGFSTSVAAKVGHGYILKYSLLYYGHITKLSYARLFVVDHLISANGNVAGAVVKYQADWEDPLNGPIMFETSNATITYRHYGHWELSQSFFGFLQPTKCTLKEKPEWLFVNVYENGIDIGLYQPNEEPQAPSADIVLTNSHGDATLHLEFQPK